MSDRIYLGVDVGRHTGLAAIDQDGRCLFRDTYELGGEYGERLTYLEDVLGEFIRRYQFNRRNNTQIALLVVEEPPRVKSTKVYNQLSGYEAIVIKTCEDSCVPYISVNNLTIKKVIVRGGAVGKSSKDDMMFKAASLIGEQVPQFDTKAERELAQNGYDAVLCAFYARYVDQGGK